MKTHHNESWTERLFRSIGHSTAHIPTTFGTRQEDGFVATVMFIGLMVIMLMLATAGGMALLHLHNEVKVLERQQIKRLDTSVTNSAVITHGS